MTNLDFDRFLESVLQDEGPQVVPGTVVDAALATARSVTQRRPRVAALDRRAWPAPSIVARTPLDSRRFVLIAVLVALAVALAVIAGVASQRPRTTLEVYGSFQPMTDLPGVAVGRRYVLTATDLPGGGLFVTGMYDTSDLADTWSMVFDPSTGEWSAAARLDQVRQGSTATALLDGRVLIAGGWHVDGEGTVITPGHGQIYDPATGRVTATIGTMVTPRLGHRATLLADGRVLITGGQGQDFNTAQPELRSAEIFDPMTETFGPVGDMVVPRQEHTATRLDDGRVLLAGGMSGHDVLATAEAETFDPATDTFSPVGAMTTARTFQGASVLSDGRVLIVGGATAAPGSSEGWTPLASAELFDPRTNTFEPTGSLATERMHPGVARLDDGRVLVAGGGNDFGGPHMAELFDPTTGTFAAAGSTARPHNEAFLDSLKDGRFLLIGSGDAGGDVAPEVWTALDQPQAVAQDVVRSRGGFEAMDTSVRTLRTGATATRLADGRVLVTGGEDEAIGAANRGPRVGSTAEILDPASGTSDVVGDMAIPRSGHVAVLLDDGRVLVAGGEQMDCQPPSGQCVWPSPSAEIFDPGTRRFQAVDADLGPATQNSFSGTPLAVGLGDGRVLYVGTAFAAGSQDWDARRVYLIDPRSGGSVETAPIPCIGRVSLVRLPDERILVQCGGSSTGTYVYDPTGGAISTLDRLADWDAAAGLRDGRVFVTRATGATAIFDPTGVRFTPTGSLVVQRADQSDRYPDPFDRVLTLLADGRVLVTGGRVEDQSLRPLESSDAEIFDPVAGTSQPVGPMLAGRWRHTATVLENGRVLLVGGVSRSPDRTDPEPLAVELYDPTAFPASP